MHSQFVRQYYFKEGILDRIFELCEKREVVPVFNKKYGKRPSEIPFMGDLEFFVKQGVTSFHASVEKWKQPLSLSSDMKTADLNKLRTGWALIFDIDSKSNLEAAKTAAILLIDALEMHGIKNYSMKFSGNRGFHIGISEKSLPKEIDFIPIEEFYPRLPQIISKYLKSKIKDSLAEKLSGLDKTFKGKDPYELVDIEENWGPRHLFRMPYCFNEKSWLVSIPLTKGQLMSFKKDDAKPENVKPGLGFLDKWKENEAELLASEALEWMADKEYSSKEQNKNKKAITNFAVTKAVPEELFAPCIKRILEGLEDGRKRSLFILINFLRTVGWSWEMIEEKIREWNEKNKEALRGAYVNGQLSYARKRDKMVPPPNCDNNDYYPDIQVCEKDELCKRIKNPTSYTLRKFKAHSRNVRKKRVRKK